MRTVIWFGILSFVWILAEHWGIPPSGGYVGVALVILSLAVVFDILDIYND